MKTVAPRFNLIKDWYFCCCVDASVKNTNLYLSSLSILDNPETVSKLKGIAYEQITLLNDPWMQLYALPQVLQSFNRGKQFKKEFQPPESSKLKVKEFYTDFISRYLKGKDKVQNHINTLLEYCLEAKDSSNYAQLILKAARKINQEQHTDVSIDQPYDDLLTFSAQNLLFILTQHLLHNQSKLSKQLHGIGDFSELTNLIDTAREANYGRLAFGISLELSVELQDMPVDEIVRHMWEWSKSKVPAYEPDLLYWLGLFHYVIDDRQEVADDLLIEYRTPGFLMSRLDPESFDKSGSDGMMVVEAFFSRIGVTPKWARSNDWHRIQPFLVWQEQLIFLASTYYPDSSYEYFKLFFVPNQKFRGTLKPLFAAPRGKNIYTHKSWMDTVYFHLESFMKQVSVKPYYKKYGMLDNLELTERINGMLRFELEDHQQWVLTSPWFLPDENRIANGDPNKYRWHNHMPRLIRHCGIAFSVVKLLQHKPQTPDESLDHENPYIRYLAHCKSVCLQFYDWTKNTEPQEFRNFSNKKLKEGDKKHRFLNSIQLSMPFTGLIKVTEGMMNLVGCGYLPSINPESFVNNYRYNLRTHEGETKDTFESDLYPEVLMKWLTEAMPGANSHLYNPFFRNHVWLKRINQIHSAIQHSNARDYRNLIEATVLMRMEQPEEYLYWQNSLSENGEAVKIEKAIYWRSRHTNLPEEDIVFWKQSHRKLLLFPKDFSLTNWSLKNNGNPMHKVIRGMEVLSHPELHEHLTGEEIIKICEHSITAISSMKQPRDLDRLVRLRMANFMVELEEKLNHYTEADEHWHNLGKRIIYVLLEFGGSYEIHKALHKVYQFSNDGLLVEDQPYQRLHHSVFAYMFRYVNRQDLITGRVGEPKRIWDTFEKRELLFRQIKKLSYALWRSKHQNKGLWNSIYPNRLYEEFRSDFVQRQNLTSKILKIHDNLKEQEFTHWKQGVFNKGRRQFKLLSDQKLTNIKSAKLGRIIAIDEDSAMAIIDSGFSRHEVPLTEVSVKNGQLTLGTELVYRQEEGNHIKQSWQLNEPLPSQVKSIIIKSEELARPGTKLRKVLSAQEDGRVANENELWDLWFPDFGTHLNQTSDQEIPEYEVIAKEEGGFKIPHYFYLDYLLYLDTMIRGGIAVKPAKGTIVTGRIFTMALIDGSRELSKTRGEHFWMFSVLTGIHLRIYESDFLNKKELKRFTNHLYALEQSSSTKGLLLSFSIDTRRSQEADEQDLHDYEALKIRLASDAALDTKYYGQVDAPFDDRNGRWRTLLKQVNHRRQEVKKRPQGGFYIDLSELSELGDFSYCKSEINIKGSFELPDGENLVQLLLNTWNPREATVMAKKVNYEDIRELEGGYEAWFNQNDLQKHWFTFNDYQEGSRPGEILVHTKENISIRVPFDSITCFPHSPNASLVKKMEHRKISVAWVGYDHRKLEKPIDDLETLPGAPSLKKGLIVKIDRKGGRVGTYWKHGKNIIFLQWNIQSIEGHADFRTLAVGDLLTCEERYGKWEVKLTKRDFKGRFMWELRSEGPNSQDEAVVLGATESSTKRAHQYWVESKKSPGVLWRVNSDLELAPFDRGDLIEGIFDRKGSTDIDNWRCGTLPSHLISQFDLSFRLFLKNKYGDQARQIFGIVPKYQDYDRYCTELSYTYVEVSALRDRYDIRRYFEMDAPEEMEEELSRAENAYEGEIEKLKKQFNAINGDEGKAFFGTVLDPNSIQGNINLNQNRLKLPKFTNQAQWNDKSSWTRGLPIHSSHSTYLDYNQVKYNPQDAIFRLAAVNGNYYASFKNVLPITNPKALRYGQFDHNFRKTDEPVNKGAYKSTLPELFFVRFYEPGAKPETHPHLKLKKDKLHCLFEYGFGKTLLIPADHMLLSYRSGDGRKLGSAGLNQHKNQIFYGDSIPLYFPKRTSNSVKEQFGIESSYYLEIPNGFRPKHSQARELYELSKNKKQVHFVRFNLESGKIESVKSIDKNGNSKESQFKESIVSKANINVLMEMDFETNEIWFPATVNLKTFEKSSGESLEFIPLKFTYKKSNNQLTVLPENESVISVQAKEILPLGKNDYGLQIMPISVNSKFIGKDFTRLFILRRQFSADIDLLRRLYNRGQSDYFLGQVFLVKVKLSSSRDKRAQISIIDHTKSGISVPLLRSEKALIGMNSIANKTEFVRFLDGYHENKNNQKKGGERMILELKPGLYFSIPTKNWAIPNQLESGELLRIDIIGKQKRLIRASFGHGRYISDKKARLAVLLPKNHLWRKFNEKKNGQFQEKGAPAVAHPEKNFSVGSFSSLEATLPASQFDLNAFMMLKHPKLALIKKVKKGSIWNYHALPISNQNEYLAGRLIWDGENLFVLEMDQKKKLTLNWSSVSFSDLPADLLAKQLKRPWEYHDEATSYYLREHKGDQEVWKAREQIIKKHSCTNGPVFIKLMDGKPTLRYQDITANTYPPDELISLLKNSGPQVFTVVGVNFAESENQTHGLVLEYAPGRLVELPTEIIVAKHNKHELSLSTFNWESLQLGDSVKLSFDSHDNIQYDQLVLEKLKQGSRSCLGKNYLGSITELLRNEEGKQVGWRLGEGLFSILLPMTQPKNPGESVCINISSNDELPIDSQSPVTEGMTIPLRREDGVYSTSVSELAEYSLDLEIDEPLTVLLGVEEPSTNNLNDKLTNLFRHCGGEIPVSITHVDHDNKAIKVTLRELLSSPVASLKPGQFAIAQFIGQLAGDLLLMRVGNTVITMKLADLIVGLEIQHQARIIATIAKGGHSFEVHLTEDNRLKAGRSSTLNQTNFETKAIPCFSISDEHRNIIGSIYKSVKTQELFFVAIEHMSWVADESLDILKQGFVYTSAESLVSVKNLENGACYCSLTQSNSVANRYAELNEGDRIEVKENANILRPRKKANQFVAYHKETGIYCVCYDKNHKNSNYEARSHDVEIIEKRESPRSILILKTTVEEYESDISKSPKRLRDKVIAFDSYLGPHPEGGDSELIAQYGVWSRNGAIEVPKEQLLQQAVEWWQRHQRSEELSLFTTIIVYHLFMSAVYFNEVRGMIGRTSLMALSRNIWMRALRSFHIEALDRTTDNTVERLSKLEPTMKLEVVENIKHTYEAMIYTGEVENQDKIEATMASLGEISVPMKCLDNDRLELQLVIPLVKLTSNGHVTEQVYQKASLEIEILLSRMMNSDRDIILMSSIPYEKESES